MPRLKVEANSKEEAMKKLCRLAREIIEDLETLEEIELGNIDNRLE